MLDNLRLLPVTIIALVLLFSVKASDIWHGASQALAETKGRAEITAEGPAAPVQHAQAGQQQPAATTAQANQQPMADAGGLAGKDPALFTRSELQLLANLAERRDTLEARANDLDLRENLLQVTEERIDEKITSLKQIEDRIQGLLAKYDQQEERQIKSLVKTYESMKAKDAARIFDRLDMEILLAVVQRMKEVKMAAVLAKMNAAKAEALTVELATRHEIPDSLSKKAGNKS
jgi:flagellar motility protein MotE (MotC chaperone)